MKFHEYWDNENKLLELSYKESIRQREERRCKNKTSVLNMTINHTGDKVVMTGGDRKIRIFRIMTG